MSPRVAARLLLLVLGAGACVARRPAAPRVLLIGVDGADMGIVDRLVGEGRLPNFARLKREGASGRLRSVEPLLSPIVWTTIATGRKPKDHGVFDFIEIGPDGRPTPVTSLRRKVPALWNIATQFRVSSGFVGWYASYPAEKVDGFDVSDRLAFHQVESARAAAGATYPEPLQADLYRRIGAPAPDVAATRAAFAADPAAPLTPDGEKRIEELAKIRATTEFYRKAVPDLARRERPALLGVYFELVDACGHLFMEDAPPRRAGVADGDFAAFRDTVDRCYQYQDAVLGDLLRLEGPETLTVVVSDHGFKSGDRRPETSGRADTGLAPLWHQLYGIVFLHGGGVPAGRAIGRASVLDVAPTVLAALGVPLSRELPGHPLAFFPEARAAKTVAAYAPAPPRRLPAGSAPDAEAVRRLAALGYLGGARGSVAHDPDGRTVASYLNEGSARAADGDERGALVAFGRALELDPKNVNALTYAARIYTMQGDLDRARALQDRALAIRPNDSAVRLQRASWAIEAGRLDEAGIELDAASRIDDRLALLHLLRARVAQRRAAPADALRELAVAEGLTDSDRYLSEIFVERAGVLAESGRMAEAEAALARAAGLAPPGRLAALRGALALRQRDAKAAARFLGEAVASGETAPGVLRKLGKALAASGNLAGAESAFRRALTGAALPAEIEGAYADLSLFYEFAGRPADARRTLEEATRKLPASGPLWAMLGGAFGRESRYDEAIAAYERSVAAQPTALACKTLALLLASRRGERDRAVALWRQSLELDPAQPDVRAFLQRFGDRGAKE